MTVVFFIYTYVENEGIGTAGAGSTASARVNVKRFTLKYEIINVSSTIHQSREYYWEISSSILGITNLLWDDDDPMNELRDSSADFENRSSDFFSPIVYG